MDHFLNKRRNIMQVTKGQRFKVGDAVPNGQHFVAGLDRKSVV
jgi:hypothetical protein